MPNTSYELPEDIKSSPLYSEDLAPIPPAQRTWNKWNLAALWVGMAVCIPTYLLASYMIKSGLSWQASLVIIGLANLVITLPMVLNGDAGVSYGIPFPVVGRTAFGTKGIHLPSFLRAIVACGWFGVQTWIGGLSIYSIANAVMGNPDVAGLTIGKFIAFAIFWLINIYFIWKGTESIKWLEDYSAPILIIIGIVLIGWAYQQIGSFGTVLAQGKQLSQTSATLQVTTQGVGLQLSPLLTVDGKPKATAYQIQLPLQDNSYYTTSWQTLATTTASPIALTDFVRQAAQEQKTVDTLAIAQGNKLVKIAFKSSKFTSSVVEIKPETTETSNSNSQLWNYLLWFTAMVGFWATMSISIADITRFAKTQTDQIAGQFIGLPMTMIFYSFVGIFVTCASVLTFDDVLIAEDAPWDPVSLVAKFNSPFVIIFSQVALLIATLSTNIAANVIAPAYAFSNMFPKQVTLKIGGVITGLIGIIICPWWLINELSSLLILISGLLAPVLGILLCDYFLIRKKQLIIKELYNSSGIYSYTKGYNLNALIALVVGVLAAMVGKWIPALDFLFSLSWFTGFLVAFGVYYGLMKK